MRNLEVGEAHGHWDRVKSALKNKDCHVPVLYGMVKDHKPRAPGAQHVQLQHRHQTPGRGWQHCALAVLFMVYWSRGFKSKLSLATEDFPQFYLKMCRYYMDDGNLGSTALPPGSRLIDGKIRIVESEVEPDKNIPSDIRTSALVRDVGN